MTEPHYAVTAIGNAIVDVIAPVEDAFIEAEGLNRGSMQLIDEARAAELYTRLGGAHEVSGGSAANTIAGLAALGHRCGFIGQVADDKLGAVFARDLATLGVHYTTAPRSGAPATAQCLIAVTPDGQRTMNTFLGASQFLPSAALDRDLIAASSILYLEGYLWDPVEPRAAMEAAIAIARQAGRRVAFTLSDVFCIERHRADFHRLIETRAVDILFANEDELRCLMQSDDLEACFDAAAARVPTLVVTRGADGAMAARGEDRARIQAEPISRVVDTTGAGDLFAAGFLAGQADHRSLEGSLIVGAVCAAEVISHIGPRPETDLEALVATRLPG